MEINSDPFSLQQEDFNALHVMFELGLASNSFEGAPDIRCPRLGFTEDTGGVDLLSSRAAGNTLVTVDLIGGDYHTKQFLADQKGHKYVNQLNPTLDSVRPLLDYVNEPSVLLLRGCDQLLLPAFPYEKFKTLTALEISGCTNLTTLPQNAISQMTQLQSLVLAHLPIQHFPAADYLSDLGNLRSLVLRGCSDLHSLEEFPPLPALKSLELSHLVVETLPKSFFFYFLQLRWLIVRGCWKLQTLPSIQPLFDLRVLDLSGCTALQEIESVGHEFDHESLDMLDLSRTAFDSTPVFRKTNLLTRLFYRDARLVELGNIEIWNLKVLDLSGAQNVEDIDMIEGIYYLEALDLSRTGIESIDFVSTKRSLRQLILRECTRLQRLPEMKSLVNLEVLDVSGCEILGDLPEDLSGLPKLKELNLSGCTGLQTSVEQLPGPRDQNPDPRCRADHGSVSNEIHLVATFFTQSGFDRFKLLFDDMVGLISNIQHKSKPATRSSIADLASSETYTTMLADITYIKSKLDLLESSANRNSAEKLLVELLMAAVGLSVKCTQLDSTELMNLVRVVAKLKLLVPPTHPPARNHEKVVFNENVLRIRRRRCMDECLLDDRHPTDLETSYNSLKDLHRNCLLHFALFPCFMIFTVIKERTLFEMWYAQGLIESQESVSTIEETGRKILMDLQEKGFIHTTMFFYGESAKWTMDPQIHRFLKDRATKECLFDFDHKNGKFTAHHTENSKWACLLKSPDNKTPSFCTSAVKLQSLQNIATLFNVNENIVDIRRELFSQMRNLVVLHLGKWNFPNDGPFVVMGLKFLEELKNMKQLRLLGLDGFSTITKLPDSVCSLTNLRVLNLRDCRSLEKLPPGIGSLTSLTYLDLTNCHVLSKVPKGIKSLSKLEVLKGFVISYQVGGGQHRNACTLEELLKLQKLRKLNLVVNRDSFPETKDLEVFKEMRNLCNLKITWETNWCSEEQEPPPRGVVVRDRQALTKYFSGWKKQQRCPDEEPSKGNHLSNLKKLVMRCFPLENAPVWLDPTELNKLQKLYIVAGNLKTLLGDPNSKTWNVKTLRLMYLLNMSMDWSALRSQFPRMTYLERHECPQLSSFHCDVDGVWQGE